MRLAVIDQHLFHHGNAQRLHELLKLIQQSCARFPARSPVNAPTSSARSTIFSRSLISNMTTYATRQRRPPPVMMQNRILQAKLGTGRIGSASAL